MRKAHEILRDLTRVKTSALYSQRKVLNEAADLLEKAESTVTMGNTDTMALLTRMVNELKEENEMLKKSFFENLMKPKGPYVDLNALWKDGYTLEEYLKMKEIPEKYIITPKKTATSSLGKQIGDIEAGKVVER